jgi:hypothetical protein
VKLRSPELGRIEALGVPVVRDPAQRGFSQPCPLWQGICTIYDSPSYPRACNTYKCKLLKRLLDESTPLDDALAVVRDAKAMIEEVESLLPASSNGNFRERLAVHLSDCMESTITEDLEFRKKAGTLLEFYEAHFDVKDIFDTSEDL